VSAVAQRAKAEAFHSFLARRNGLLRRFAPRNDIIQNVPSRSRRAFRASFTLNIPPPSNRGHREDRVRAAPAVSCAKCTKKCAHEHTGSAESIRPSLRNGFTAYNALSPVTGLFATVAARILPRHLTPASGRQDHTTSPYACMHSRQKHSLRPPHPTARFVTIASRPSCG